jgi:hypothetical protein
MDLSSPFMEWWMSVSSWFTARDLYIISRYLLHIYKVEGVFNLVKRLKVALFVINSYVGGNPVKDTRPLGVAISLKNGLPSFLPQSTRVLIRAGDLKVIRTMASLCNSYKAFSAPHPDPDLESITAPPLDESLDYSDIKEFVPTFWKWMSKYSDKIWSRSYIGIDKPYLSVKAGPNHRISVFGSALDAFVWTTKYPLPSNLGADQWDSPLGQYVYQTKNWRLMGMLVKSVNFLFRPEFYTQAGFPPGFNARFAYLGKLSIKEEPAGKVRVFAILDYWTQRALRPLHDWIFEVLSTVPSDATFDQEGALKAHAAKGLKNHFCYDLKSATDMIPTPLYKWVFGHILGDDLVRAWINLLVDRDFSTVNVKGSKTESVRYTRGQPMGAYSSWGGLAVVHHFLVQFAAYQAGHQEFFVDYLVLGDDICISNQDVAKQYILACDKLGIPIGLAKSYESNTGFINFANQSILGEHNISPASLKEEIQVDGAAARTAFAARLVRRGWAQCKSTTGMARLARLFLRPSEIRSTSSNLAKGQGCGYLAKAFALALMPRFGSNLGLPEVSFSLWCRTLLLDTKMLSSDVLDRAASTRFDSPWVILDMQTDYMKSLMSELHRVKALCTRLNLEGGDLFDSEVSVAVVPYGHVVLREWIREYAEPLSDKARDLIVTAQALFSHFGEMSFSDRDQVIEYVSAQMMELVTPLSLWVENGSMQILPGRDRKYSISDPVLERIKKTLLLVESSLSGQPIDWLKRLAVLNPERRTSSPHQNKTHNRKDRKRCRDVKHKRSSKTG